MSPRLTRWSIFLTGYNYKLVHWPRKSISNADALSRCPVPEFMEDPMPAAQVMLIDIDKTSPITSTDIAEYTSNDKMFSKVLNRVLRRRKGGE